MADTRTTLLTEINEFLSEHALSETAFGVMAVNDGHLIRDLRARVDFRASRIDRVRNFMANYRPLGRRQKKGENSAAA